MRYTEAGQTHRDVYPEQYSHPLVGKRVSVKTFAGEQGVGEVTRVFGSGYGPLAEVAGVGNSDTAWRVSDCAIALDT